MDSGVIAALITAVIAILVALVSGWFSLRSVRDVERLRHTYEAIDRLGGATGALRLQLFLSTRSVVQRLRQYYNGRPEHPFPLRAERDGWPESQYHACGLLIFRLMRPLAVSYMIEQETLLGDLLLEPAMVDLLRFNHAAFEMLTGDKLGEEFEGRQRFPDFEMEHCYDPPGRRPPPASGAPVPPFQRVRASYLRSAAGALIVSEPDRKPQRRCMTHDEFLDRWERPGESDEIREFHGRLAPVKATIDKFSPMDNAVFWLRLVGYAYVCKWFHDRVREDAKRKDVGVHYTPVELPVRAMLEVAEGQARKLRAADPQAAGRGYLTQNADAYEKRFEEIIATAL